MLFVVKWKQKGYPAIFCCWTFYRKRLAATANRRGTVYSWAGKPSETFYGKEEQENGWMTFFLPQVKK